MVEKWNSKVEQQHTTCSATWIEMLSNGMSFSNCGDVILPQIDPVSSSMVKLAHDL